MTIEAGKETPLATEEVSQPFLGQWRHLISTTNWNKGKIIHDWREALVAADAPVSEYSDEVWAGHVGQVSPQHVGRLRRTHERFGEVREQYDGLSWSHFQAALDWDDSEMWLEGAVQSRWSVSQMRNQRWEANGGKPEDKPEAKEIVDSEFDEDVSASGDTDGAMLTTEQDEVRDPSESFEGGSHESFAPDYGDESASGEAGDSDVPFDADESNDATGAGETLAAPRRTLADLPQLPSDLGDAFESFKVAVLNHRLTNWQSVNRDDVLATIDALRELVLAETEAEASSEAVEAETAE